MTPAAPPIFSIRSFVLVVVLAGTVAGRVVAQKSAPDSSRRIVAIELDREPVFVGNEGSLAGKIGNTLHTTTHAPFIRAELLFAAGDQFDSTRVDQSARNLRALGIFSFVNIDTVRTDSGLVVRVHTKDAWSQQLITAFKSTGGAASYTLGLKDINLLGSTATADGEFHHTFDRNYFVFLMHRDRLIDNKIGATLQYVPRSDGTLSSLVLVQPWYSDEQRNGMTVAAVNDREQILRFRDGNDSVASQKLAERYVLGRVDLGHAIIAARDHYTRVGVVLQARRDDFVPADSVTGNEVLGRTVTASVGAYIETKVREHFVLVRGFQAFVRNEDIDLSTVIRVSAFAAPDFLGYHNGTSGVVPGISAHTGFTFPGGFAYQDFVASGLYGSSGLDSGQVIGSTTIALIPKGRHQLIMHAEAGALKNPVPGSEFDLGQGEGPRAFAPHAFTGDREFFLSADYRFAFAPNLLKVVGLGLAAFGDYGGAWFVGESRRTGWDAGVGLRFAFTSDADPSPTRFDLAWQGARRALPGIPAAPGQWVFSVVRGLPFAFGPRGTPR